jgi:hypothetical protein
MKSCPNCNTVNIYETVNRGISACEDCGAEFKDDVIFKEGSYKEFMSNVLNLIAESLQPNAASSVITIRDNALGHVDDVQSVVEALMTLTENVNADRIVGYDRTEDIRALVEGIEKIIGYAKIMTKRKEISERTAYLMSLLEGSDPSSWMYPPDEIPDLPGEITQDEPSSSDIVNADDEDKELWREATWMGNKVKVSCKEGKYNVIGENGPMITYNQESDTHDGIENFTEEQLAELESLAQDTGAQGTIISNETEDPAAEAEELSKSMIDGEGLDDDSLEIDPLEDESTLETVKSDIQVAKDAIENIEATIGSTDVDDSDDLDDLEVDGAIEDEIEGSEAPNIDLQELAAKKFGSAKFDGSSKPEIVKAKLEATGKAPDGHVVKYVTSKKDPSKQPGEQWTEEEAKIPLTQAEAEKSLVDENGIKKKDKQEKKETKYGEKEFKAGRLGTKSVNESTRFNGYRIGDKIKVPGYTTSFELIKISGSPVKFTLSEGNVKITLDANEDKFELDGDRDIKWQRTTSIIEDARADWEELEKSLLLNEGCAGGVCSIAGPLSPLNVTSGIGGVVSASAMFTKTPIRNLNVSISPNSVYAYIKNNNLHNSPRQDAINHVLSNFQDPNLDVEKIFDDAVSSEKNTQELNEVDSSYSYETKITRGVDVERILNEGYDSLKKLGIV